MVSNQSPHAGKSQGSTCFDSGHQGSGVKEEAHYRQAAGGGPAGAGDVCAQHQGLDPTKEKKLLEPSLVGPAPCAHMAEGLGLTTPLGGSRSGAAPVSAEGLIPLQGQPGLCRAADPASRGSRSPQRCAPVCSGTGPLAGAPGAAALLRCRGPARPRRCPQRAPAPGKPPPPPAAAGPGSAAQHHEGDHPAGRPGQRDRSVPPHLPPRAARPAPALGSPLRPAWLVPRGQVGVGGGCFPAWPGPGPLLGSPPAGINSFCCGRMLALVPLLYCLQTIIILFYFQKTLCIPDQISQIGSGSSRLSNARLFKHHRWYCSRPVSSSTPHFSAGGFRYSQIHQWASYVQARACGLGVRMPPSHLPLTKGHKSKVVCR